MRELNKLNDFKLMLPKINKRFIILTAIFVAGSILATAYASNTVIDNTSVSTTTVNTVDLHVTGTCTGCGGGSSEGTFTTWTTLTNSSISTTNLLNGAVYCKIGTNANVLYSDSNSVSLLFSSTPSLLVENDNSINPSGIVNFDQSLTGKYQIIQPSSGLVSVYSNGTLVKNLGFTSSNFAGGTTECISPDGKYIALMGKASSNHARVVILKGS